MGQRQLNLLGRIGMVLLVSGLALGLVSFIPSYSYSQYNGQFLIDAQEYVIPYYLSRVYTPQAGFSISVDSNDSMYFYLVAESYDQIYNWTASWVTEHYPDLEPYEIWSATLNLSVLNTFLQLHQDIILWNSSLTENVSREFFPTSVLNVTAVIANPSDHSIMVNIVAKDLTSFAPRERVSLAAEFLILVGLVFAAPWAIKLKVKKKAPAE